jgi:hypothetical protein
MMVFQNSGLLFSRITKPGSFVLIKNMERLLHLPKRPYIFRRKNPHSIIMIGTNQSYSARREMLGKELWLVIISSPFMYPEMMLKVHPCFA